MRCDNAAAIVLSKGEGSWRTKSAANKVYAIREKVDCGMLEIEYVPTADQCADSLTKFLKSGQEQARVNVEHLGLIDLKSWLPEVQVPASISAESSAQSSALNPAQSLTKNKPSRNNTRGVRFSDKADFHGVRICRVNVLGSIGSNVLGDSVIVERVPSSGGKNSSKEGLKLVDFFFRSNLGSSYKACRL